MCNFRIEGAIIILLRVEYCTNWWVKTRDEVESHTMPVVVGLLLSPFTQIRFLADICWLRALGYECAQNWYIYVGLQLPSFWKNKGRPNLFYRVLDTNVYQCGLKGGDPTERICFTHHVLHPEQQAVYKFLLLELLNWNVWTELYPQVCSFSQASLPLLRWIYFHIMFKGLPPLCSCIL